MQNRLDLLTQQSISDLVKEAQSIQAYLLNKLKLEYGKVLAPNHKPNFWDPFKTRHYKKMAIGHNAVTACQTGINTILDINQFYMRYQELKNQNQKIDEKGGRLGKIFQSIEGQIDELNQKMNKYILSKKISTTRVCDIINHQMSFELEQLECSKIPTPTIIADRIDEMIKQNHKAKIQQAFEDLNNSDQEYANILAVKTSDFLKSIEKNVTNDIVKDSKLKVSELKSYVRRYLNELTIIDLYASSNEKEFILASNQDKLKYYFFKSIINEFEYYFKIEEKRKTITSYLNTKNKPDRINFTDQEKKENFHKAVYNSEESQLDTNFFFKNLKILFYKNIPVEELLKIIETQMQAHFERYLHETNCNLVTMPDLPEDFSTISIKSNAAYIRVGPDKLFYLNKIKNELRDISREYKLNSVNISDIDNHLMLKTHDLKNSQRPLTYDDIQLIGVTTGHTHTISIEHKPKIVLFRAWKESFRELIDELSSKLKAADAILQKFEADPKYIGATDQEKIFISLLKKLNNLLISERPQLAHLVARPCQRELVFASDPGKCVAFIRGSVAIS